MKHHLRNYSVQVNPAFDPSGQLIAKPAERTDVTETHTIAAPSKHGALLIAEQRTGQMAVQAQLAAQPCMQAQASRIIATSGEQYAQQAA